MFRKLTATTIASILFAAAAAGPALAQHSPPSAVTSAAAAGTPASGFSIPVDANTIGVGSFTGTLRITRFATDGVKLVAIGLLTGTLTDELGGQTSIIKNLSIPVTTPARAAPGAKVAATCDVLNLVLGPLDLNLLGLQIHLNQVVLDIVAVTGAGNLLGNLLCAITNLLNGPGALIDLVNALNQLITLLGG